jgi:hypothetical protein
MRTSSYATLDKDFSDHESTINQSDNDGKNHLLEGCFAIEILELLPHEVLLFSFAGRQRFCGFWFKQGVQIRVFYTNIRYSCQPLVPISFTGDEENKNLCLDAAECRFKAPKIGGKCENISQIFRLNDGPQC